MSGETVKGKALQFTNDNKHAYAYSGLVEVESTEIICLEFNTNSEYLIAEMQMCYFSTNETDNIKFMITFDNIEIQTTQINDAFTHTPYTSIKLIIPPFTLVKVTGKNISGGGTRDIGVSVTAKVGMPPRVGNLVE